VAQQQAESGPSFTGGAFRRHSPIEPEEFIHVLWRHPEACIRNRDFNEAATAPRSNRDLTAGGRELYRVADEIAEHREQHVTMGAHMKARAVGLQR
jgi:hypothetical protein